LLCADYHESMTIQGPPAGAVRAQIQPSGQQFTAATDRTLLQAALAAGIEIPNSCRNGTCRACIRPLLAGQVHYRIAWPGLLPEEKGSWVLPCVAYPLTDVVLGE
jgi:ferredoxin